MRADPAFLPSRTWSWRTSTSTLLNPLGIRRRVSHQLTRSNHLTGSAPTAHSLPLLSTAVGLPSVPVLTITCSMPASYGRGPTFSLRERPRGKTQSKLRGDKKPRSFRLKAETAGFAVGPTGIEPMTSTV